MQPDSIAVLKKREKKWLNQFPHQLVILNQYETYLNDKSQFFRVFEIKTQPQVQTDSYPVFSAAMKHMPQSIKKALEADYFGKRSYTIWYLAKNQLTKQQIDQLKAKPPTYNIQMDQGMEYKVVLKFVKQSKITEKENVALITQFLNIRLKQLVLTKCKMKELVRNTFFPRWTQYYRNDKFQVEAKIGFKFNLEYFQIQLFCDINNRLREMNQRSFLEVLREKRDSLAYYNGKRVIKRYGNQKTFVIDKIDPSMNPTKKFSTKDGVKMTYVEFYKKNYQIDITDLTQPLIAVTQKKYAAIRKGTFKIEEQTQTIYLIPELVSLAEIPQAAKKALKKELTMSPNECIETADSFIKQVNKNQTQFKIIAENRRGYAHLLPNPKIQINLTQTIQPYDGAFRVQHEVYEPIQLTDVLVVYSVSKDKNFDRKSVDEAIKMLNKSGERYKIKIKEHFCLELLEHATPEDWIKQVEEDSAKNGKPKFALFVFIDHEKDFYPILKDHLTYRLDIDSQMFLRDKIGPHAKGSLKIAGNIMKQIATKKNQTLWKIHPIKIFQEKLVLIIGISIQKMGSRFQLVIARNTNKDVSKFKTKAYQIESREIPELILEQQFYSAMQDYIKYEKKKFKPTTVIVYRMGLNNEKFVEEHVEKEYSMLYKRVKYICENKLKQPYFPELVYIQTIDKPSQKIWIQEEGNQPNSFLPKVANPQVGTVMRGQSDNEFYLIPYKARQGTVYPSLYRVMKNEGKVPMEYITQLTYAHTYMYYNWEGSVRLPEVLQYCKKAHQYVKSKEYKDKVFETPLYI